MRKKMKIGVFGGTFDPMHNGHLFLAEHLKHALKLNRVIYVPCGSPALKRAPIAHEKDRLIMIRKMVPKSDVSVIEIIRKGTSYAIDTIRELKRIFGSEATLYLLIGADIIPEIKKWKDWKALMRECRIVAISRPGTGGFSGSSCLTAPWDRKYEIKIVRAPSLNISSTIVRKRIKTGLPVRGMVPDKILNYIKKKGLYVSGKTNN